LKSFVLRQSRGPGWSEVSFPCHLQRFHHYRTCCGGWRTRERHNIGALVGVAVHRPVSCLCSHQTISDLAHVRALQPEPTHVTINARESMTMRHGGGCYHRRSSGRLKTATLRPSDMPKRPNGVSSWKQKRYVTSLEAHTGSKNMCAPPG
jgi:hypothetical protein